MPEWNHRLGCDFAPRGMCCLVLNRATNVVQVAPTLQPAGAVNLEYLSVALSVRLQEGREPLFSLDRSKDTSLLVKRFEPGWLAGTSVGDVLFQSDFYLKELSMGEHDQPVAGNA